MHVYSPPPRRYRRTPTKQIAVHIDQPTLEHLRALCSNWDRPQDAVVRHLIEFRIAAFPPEERDHHEQTVLKRRGLSPPRRRRPRPPR